MSDHFEKINEVLKFLARWLPGTILIPIAVLLVRIGMDSDIKNLPLYVMPAMIIALYPFFMFIGDKRLHQYVYRLKWIDLYNHMALTCAMCFLFSTVMYPIEAVLVAFMIGFLKEIYDTYSPYSRFSTQDLWYNLFGVFSFIALSGGLNNGAYGTYLIPYLFVAVAPFLKS